MAEYKRTPSNISEQRNIGNGPFLARIVSHLDPTFMGSLEVTLLRHQANIASDDTLDLNLWGKIQRPPSVHKANRH